jgi:ribosome-binding factor A
VGLRLLKVNESLREVLSQEIPALKDPRIGFVTVTGVQTSADLRHAKVFVSVLGNTPARERTLAGLRAAHGRLQERIAADVRIKRTPQLQFLYDESIERGMRIETLLQRYEGELGEPAADDADDGEPVADDADGEPAADGSIDGEPADDDPHEP